MKCPHTKGVINPTFIRLYHDLFGEEYVNTKGGLSYKSKFHSYTELQQHLTSCELLHFKPKVPPFIEVPCGKCSVCMANKKQDWIYRLKQELDASPGAMFITLTYNDLYLPFKCEHGEVHRLSHRIITNCDAQCSLVKADLQKWFKRLRKACEPLTLRYFAVGEYGGKFGRPHYHILLFGLPFQLTDEYDPLKIIQDTWPLGQVDIAECNGRTINYVVSYLDLKEYKPNQWSEPQFCVMSRRPGIGSQVLYNNDFAKFFTKKRLIDNTAMVAHDGLQMPLPRFYKDKLYSEVDRLEKQKYNFANKPILTEYDYEQQRKDENLAAHKETILNQRATRKKLHA